MSKGRTGISFYRRRDYNTASAELPLPLPLPPGPEPIFLRAERGPAQRRLLLDGGVFGVHRRFGRPRRKREQVLAGGRCPVEPRQGEDCGLLIIVS